MRRPATVDERRERTDRLIVDAIERARAEGDSGTAARLQRDRLENALTGFAVDEYAPLASGRAPYRCPECGTWQAKK